MAYYHRMGTIPHKRHTQFRQPDGSLYHEEVMGIHGFAGIQSLLRPTDVAAAAFDGWAPGGAREVLVAAADLERARELVDEK